MLEAPQLLIVVGVPDARYSLRYTRPAGRLLALYGGHERFPEQRNVIGCDIATRIRRQRDRIGPGAGAPHELAGGRCPPLPVELVPVELLGIEQPLLPDPLVARHR